MSAIREHAATDKVRWPLINLACTNERVATSTKVEWLIHDRPSDRFGSPDTIVSSRVEFNYTEVFRAPDWKDLLDSIEHNLAHGKRNFDATGPRAKGYMGSIRELLGRHERKGDYISLRILQDLVKLVDYGDGDQYVAEVSVLARRGS